MTAKQNTDQKAPSSDARSLNHWDEYWRGNESDVQTLGGEQNKPVLDAFWRELFARNDALNFELIVDLGGGSGALREIVRDAGGDQAYCVVDTSPSAIKKAKTKGVAGAVGDASQLPFADYSVDAVLSQYGVEYAGKGGFAEAARVLSPGGVFGAVIHYQGGAIDLECAAQAEILQQFEVLGLLKRMKDALTTSYALKRENSAILVHEALEASLQDAAAQVKAVLVDSPGTTARQLLMRYFNDLGQLSERRFAFEEAEAMAWLEHVGAAIKQYRRRMESMSDAACAKSDIDDISAILGECGVNQVEIRELIFGEGSLPGAWIIEAKKT